MVQNQAQDSSNIQGNPDAHSETESNRTAILTAASGRKIFLHPFTKQDHKVRATHPHNDTPKQDHMVPATHLHNAMPMPKFCSPTSHLNLLWILLPWKS